MLVNTITIIIIIIIVVALITIIVFIVPIHDVHVGVFLVIFRYRANLRKDSFFVNTIIIIIIVVIIIIIIIIVPVHDKGVFLIIFRYRADLRKDSLRHCRLCRRGVQIRRFSHPFEYRTFRSVIRRIFSAELVASLCRDHDHS